MTDMFSFKKVVYLYPLDSLFHCSVETLSKQEGDLCNLKDALPIEMMCRGTSAWEGMGDKSEVMANP